MRTLCFTIDLDRDVNEPVPGSVCAASKDRGEGNAPRFTSSGRGTERLVGMLDDLGVSPHQAAYVGDSIVDVQVARNAGTRAIGVSWGYDAAAPLPVGELDAYMHAPGELVGVVGANGSGKSTLLSLICADNPQGYACDIRLFGHRRGSGESIWEIKRHIGYVSPELHRAYRMNIPAIDLVASGLHDTIGLYVRTSDGDRARCRFWMEIMGIGHLAERPFLQLSSGEQRLCLLARAFVKDPELLILDEPLHGLDDEYRERVREIVTLFCQRRHKTLIMVTHYPDELPPCITHHLDLVHSSSLNLRRSRK